MPRQYILSCLSKFFEDALPTLGERYYWPQHGRQLQGPFGYVLSSDNCLQETLRQRRFLADLWRKQPLARFDIAKWYVKDWGRIRRISDRTLAKYVSEADDDTIARSVTGIASWSKILAVSRPERYVIYDARVASSLNAIQLKYSEEGILCPFPIPPSRNGDIIAFRRKISSCPSYANRSSQLSSNVYQLYIDIISHGMSPQRDWRELHFREMALFTDAKCLIKNVSTSNFSHPAV